jgi:hypothetical protein
MELAPLRTGLHVGLGRAQTYLKQALGHREHATALEQLRKSH